MNNKDFDKILKPLRDYDPQVKPDWEAFVAASGGELNNPAKTSGQSTGSFSKVGMMKYAAILVTIASGIFFLWNYNSSSNADENTSADAPRAIKTIETPFIPAKADANTTLPQFRNSKKSLLDNSGIYQLELNANESTDAENLTPTPEILSTEEKTAYEDAQPVIIKTSDTVRVQKTIIVRDTINIQKPKVK
jgi:hypothetical protein